MADLPSILGGMAQGFIDFGKGAVDLFGTGGAAIGDLVDTIRTGKVTTKNQDDFRKWLYQTDSTKDAAAKGLGTALNGVQTVADYIPGVNVLTRNPLGNAAQGALGGLADEFKTYGENYDLGRAGQRAAVSGAAAAASGSLADALKGSSNALLSSNTLQGLARGATGGAITGGGYAAIDGGDVLEAAKQGAGMGALIGGATGLAQDFKPAKTYDVGLTDEERASRLKEVRKMRNAIGSEKAYMSGALDEASENRWSELYNLEQAYKNGFDSYNDYHNTLRPTKGLDDETLGLVLKNMEEPELQPWMQKGSHQPTFDPTMSSLASSMDRTVSGESFMPDDFYQHMDWYGGGDTKPYLESASAIQKIRGNPNAKVTMYRATVGDKIYPNDWVTLSPEYARQHLANALRDQPDAKIIKQTVAARDLRWPGDDINEFGYYPITNGDIAKVKALETTLADADMAVNNPKLTPEQEAYFKDSVIRDENGNLMPMYHGSNSNFTVFDSSKGGQSNKTAKVGHWFTPSKEGAEKWAGQAWWGDNDPTVYETYLNIKKPMVYETIDNSAQIKKLETQLKQVEDRLNSTYRGSQEYYDAYKEYNNIADEIDNLSYTDPYEQFRSHIYAMEGKTPSQANVGGVGMAMNDEDAAVQKYVDMLKGEGYDGIIIKGTGYDQNVMGGPNDQYVVFDSNQIKNVNNLNPTSDPDIRLSKTLDGALVNSDQSINDAYAKGIKRIGSSDVAPVNPDTLPESIRAAKGFLDKDYIKDIENYSGKKIGNMTDSELIEYALSKKPEQDREVLREAYSDIMKGGTTARDVAESVAKNAYLYKIGESDFSDGDAGGVMDYLLHHGAQLREGRTKAADIELSDRLGIAPSNTFMRDNANPYDSYGSYDPSSTTISIGDNTVGENAIGTVGHERLHSFQVESLLDRYDKEVLDAYKDLSKDLDKYIKTDAEIAKLHADDPTDLAYWGNKDEQQARMLQQYLENKNFTKTGSIRNRAKEWGNEINPAFDKFFDKLRSLSKRGVALPALAALFGGGAYMASQEKDKEEVK